MASERIKKLNDLIRDVAAKVLQEEFFHDENVLITVTRAEVSFTLEHATVYISVLPDREGRAVIQELKKAMYDLQQSINKRLAMRPMPKIRFEIDATEAHAARIEKLLENIEK